MAGPRGTTRTNSVTTARELSVVALFVLLLLAVGLVLSAVWFLSSGRYLSATLGLLAALAFSHAAGRFLLLATATRKR